MCPASGVHSGFGHILRETCLRLQNLSNPDPRAFHSLRTGGKIAVAQYLYERHQGNLSVHSSAKLHSSPQRLCAADSVEVHFQQIWHLKAGRARIVAVRRAVLADETAECACPHRRCSDITSPKSLWLLYGPTYQGQSMHLCLTNKSLVRREPNPRARTQSEYICSPSCAASV